MWDCLDLVEISALNAWLGLDIHFIATVHCMVFLIKQQLCNLYNFLVAFHT